MYNTERSLRADVPKLKSFDLADHCVYRLGLFSTARRGRQRLLTIGEIGEGEQRVCSAATRPEGRRSSRSAKAAGRPAALAFRLTGAQL
ncbi:Uncharacterized protein TSPI_02309 [Trichinella spiralis]|uniref:Uncharacterized protein n=1 Tax=Trichinella spiralis TaxID=6334 RepID=A0ABR3KP34_TRISP